MTTQVLPFPDPRPPLASVAGLYLNAWVQIWKGMAMMMAIPLALFIRGESNNANLQH